MSHEKSHFKFATKAAEACFVNYFKNAPMFVVFLHKSKENRRNIYCSQGPGLPDFSW
jgi:hypothetical protein